MTDVIPDLEMISKGNRFPSTDTTRHMMIQMMMRQMVSCSTSPHTMDLSGRTRSRMMRSTGSGRARRTHEGRLVLLRVHGRSCTRPST